MVHEENIYSLIEDNSNCIGYGHIRWNSKINPEMTFLFIFLLPEYRGKSISKLVLKKLVLSIPTRTKEIYSQMRVDQNNPLFEYQTHFINYITTKGGLIAYKSRRSTSDLKKFQKDAVSEKAKELRSKASTKGFRFEFVENKPDYEKLGFSVEEFITLLERINNDRPRENSALKNNTLPIEVLNYKYDINGPLKRTRWHYIAINKETNKLVGITEVHFSKFNSKIINQSITGVLVEYRGNALGLTLKYLMLDKILTTESISSMNYWVTYNAFSNTHMIQINDSLEHKKDAIWYQIEIHKEELFEILKD